MSRFALKSAHARTVAILLAGTALSCPGIAFAQEVEWDGSEGSDFRDGANWNSGSVPGSTNTVTINSSGASPQPILSGPDAVATVQSMSVGRMNTGSLIVREGATLNIVGDITVGGVSSNSSSAINAARFGNGILTITGAGSQVNTLSLTMGRGASGANLPDGGASGFIEVLNGGTLRVTNGALIGASVNTANPGNSGFAVLRVSGAGSTLEIAQPNGSNIEIRNSGSALEILDGAQLIGAANWGIRTVGGLRVSGLGTEASFGNSISFGSGSAALADAAMIVENGGIFRVNILNTSASTAGPDSASIIVRSGAQAFANQVQLSGPRGVLLVDGASLNVTGSIRLDDASATPSSDLILRNANIQAESIITTGARHLVAIGALENEAAGAVGTYDVRDLGLATGSRLALNHAGNPLTINSNISGAGLIQQIAGTTILTGTSTNFNGETRVTGGTLRVNDNFGIASHTMTVANGATLGGSGRIGGNVTIADATLAAGNSVGTLTFVNNLVLSANSILEFELGAPSGMPGMGSDLITVLGNLTLDGTLNITNVGGFGAGLYRLFDYGGTLTDNGLEFGGVPMGFTAEDLAIQTSVARQVNLLVAAPPPELGSFSFWDGANLTANDTIDGGTGTWSAAGSNWTDATGATNGAYDPDTLLIFAGTGGRVTIDEPGGIAVNNGLQFASDGYVIGGDRIALGDGPVVIRVGDGTMEGAGYTAIIEADIGGAGSIEKTDLGGLILTGDVAAAGGTTITNGTLQIGNGEDTGSISGDIANFGTLLFNRTGEVSYGGAISGTGGLIQRGPGVLTLGSNHTFTGGTRIEGGTLSNLGTLASATAISAGGTLNNSGTVGAIANDGTFTNSGVIGGTVINNAPATLTSTGTIDGAVSNFGTAQLGGNINGVFANRAGGAVTITAPTTFVDFQQDAGGSFDLADQTAQMNGLSGDGTFALGTGTLTISPSAAIGSNQFNGQITGAGALVIDGEGALFLGGDNSYTGGTDVRTGELRGDTGSLQGAITVNEGGLLVFQQIDDGSFAGTLAGNGLISTSGLGQLVINGENSFTGTLSSSGRELQINGNLGQATVQMLATGGTLSGTGTAGAIRLFAGNAIIAPGAAPQQVGTFNVLGNFNDLGVDFIYDADVVPMAADRITVGGTANLAGSLAINAAPGSYRFGSYVLLSAAGGRTGEFGIITGLGDFGAGFRPTLSYTGTEVVLRIAPNAIADVLGDTPLTFNQRSAVTRFDAAVTSGLTDPNGFIAFYDLPVAAIPAAFDALSGEVHASAARLVLDDERMVRRATLDQLAATTGTEGGNAWIGALGRFGNVDSDGNAAKITRESIGIIIGADIGDASGDDSQGWRAGVQGHYLRTSFTIDDRASSGTIDRFGGGVYGALRTGGFGVKLGATIASVDLATTRSIMVPGFSETAASDASGTAFQGYGEVNYRIEASSVTLEPFAGINHTRFDIGTVAESGQLAAVSVAARDDRLTVADAGLRGMATVKTGETGRIDLRAAIGVRQVLGDRNLTADLAFVSVPTVGFAVATIAQDRTAFAPEIGIDAQLGGGLSLGLSYEGVIGKTASDHGIRAALRLAF